MDREKNEMLNKSKNLSLCECICILDLLGRVNDASISFMLNASFHGGEDTLFWPTPRKNLTELFLITMDQECELENNLIPLYAVIGVTNSSEVLNKYYAFIIS